MICIRENYPNDWATFVPDEQIVRAIVRDRANKVLESPEHEIVGMLSFVKQGNEHECIFAFELVECRFRVGRLDEDDSEDE